jgi:hypothetical protein
LCERSSPDAEDFFNRSLYHAIYPKQYVPGPQVKENAYLPVPAAIIIKIYDRRLAVSGKKEYLK